MEKCGAIVALITCACGGLQRQRPEVIDVHLHFAPHDPVLLGKLADPVTGAPQTATGEESLRAALTRAMDQAHVVLAVVSDEPEPIARWHALEPKRIVQACGPQRVASLDVAALRKEHAAGRCAVLAEIQPFYEGIAPDDTRLEPLWALAEELDVPVGFHLHPGPPGVSQAGAPAARLKHANPLLLDDVLVRHPKLRLYVMHAGWPFAQEMIALLYAHPELYVDLGVIDWTLTPALFDSSRRGEPPHEFYSYLQRLMDLGFGKRILFGSDAMVWPDALPRAVDNVLAAPFLSDGQKRDILHDNAVRFFRLNAF